MKRYVLVFAAVFALCPAVFADVWYVDKDNKSGIEDGTSWSTAFTNIGTAVGAAAESGGGEVWVAEGLYPESVTLSSGVSLYGGFGGTETVLSERDIAVHVTTIGTGPSDRVAVGDGVSNALLDGFSIAGIYSVNPDDTNTVANCKVAGAASSTAAKAADASPGKGVTVVGIEGGNGKDVIVNNDDLLVSSSDSGEANVFLTLTGSEEADETTTLTSGAVAIDTGNGPDKITNTKKGTITSRATSELTNVDISMDLAGFSYGDASSSIDSTAVGIIGGNGSDKITNASGGQIAAEATSKLTDLDFELNLKLADFSHADALPTLNSTAVGIIGGNGKDTVDNAGLIEANARSEILILSGEVNTVDAAQSALANASIEANADATALDLGLGADLAVTNSGTIATTATSDVRIGDFNVSYLDITLTDQAGGSASTGLTSVASGIIGGKGSDTISITQEGRVDTVAESYAQVGSVALASEGVPAGLGALVEGTLNDTSVTSSTTATGIMSGDNNDRITDDGTIYTKADSTAIQWSANVGVALIDYVVPTPGIVIGGAGTEAISTATGIDGGSQNDDILIGRQMDVVANSEATAVAVSANLDIDALTQEPFGTSGPVSGSFVAADTSSTADSDAMGVVAGEGNDTIANTGIINVGATSDNETAAASATFGTAGENKLNFQLDADAVLARATATGDAFAVGLDGGKGNDTVQNEGELHVDSTADLNTAAVTVDFQTNQGTFSVVAGGSLTDTSSMGYTTAEAIRGGEGNDTIINTEDGNITSDAESTIEGASVSVEMAFAEEGITAGAALSRSETYAESTAGGIDAGSGYNQVLNEGSLLAESDSEIDFGTVAIKSGVTWKGTGAVLGAAVADSSATAIADARGIAGGSDKDTIVNAETGTITADAGTNIDVGAVSLDVGLTNKGVSLGAALSRSETIAGSTAVGITTGDKKDEILNVGALNAIADSDITSASVSVNISGTMKGVSGGASLADSSIVATSSASGIESGEDKDIITNTGDITVTPTTDTNAVSVGVSVAAAGKGLAAGAALAKATNTSGVNATGIDAGEGKDSIHNDGTITLGTVPEDEDDAMAKARATSVSVDIHGAMQGVALGAAVTDASTTATADATAVKGGTGRDEIVNAGTISVNPTTYAYAESDAISVGIVGTGVAADVALARATTDSQLWATGIDGGDDRDQLVNTGTITVGFVPETDKAMARSSSTSVSVDIGGTVKGVALGAALTDTSSTAKAHATGMNGGAGDDEILNTNTITALPSADAVATSVSGAGKIAVKGVSGAMAGAKSTTTSDAFGTGIDGSGGDDKIANTGTITVGSDPEETAAMARAEATSVAVTIAGAGLGASFGVPVTDTSATATSDTKGIDGGTGDDEILNTDAVTVYSSADADATSASAGLSITGGGLSASLAMAKATNDANASAKGIDAGDGEDVVENEGEITVKADSDATSKVVALSISATGSGVSLGGALSDGSAGAVADAAGIDAGAGDDVIGNRNTISVDALSESDTLATSAQFALTAEGAAAGVALSKAESTADAFATGIHGGEGDDQIASDAGIGVNAVSDGEATSVSVSIALSGKASAAGSAADASAGATSRGTGIQGGGGDDEIFTDIVTSNDKIAVNAESTAVAESVAVSGAGSLGLAANASVSDSSAGAESYATGIDGGLGDEIIVNARDIESTSSADADAGSTSVGVSIGAVAGGFGWADSSANANASSTGIEAGGGDDRVINTGNITAGHAHNSAEPMATATADSTTVQVGVSLLGGVGESFSDSSANAAATATGIATGLGDDWVNNSGAITVGADPEDPKAMAKAQAASTNTTVTVSVGAALNAASSDASANAASAVRGIATDLGDDRIKNTGLISAVSKSEAVANSKTNQFNFSLGLAVADTQSDASTVSRALATGIDSGGGADELFTSSQMAVKAVSTSTSTGTTKATNILPVGVSLQSAVANTSGTADATARGIDGGAGGDAVLAEGALDVSAEAVATGKSRSAAVNGPVGAGLSIQEAQAEAATVASSLAIGIDGGDGDDAIESDATITLNAISDASAESVSATNSGFNIVGASFGESAADASTLAASAGIGIAGGDGLDDIRSNKAISVTAKSTAIVDSTSTVNSETFIGAATGKAASEGSARLAAMATGIDGGAGGDTITSRDAITVLAVSDGTAESNARAEANVEFGTASTNTASAAAAEAMAGAAGISGGEGDDTILSFSSVDATAKSKLDVTVSSVSISEVTFGAAFAGAAANSSSQTSAAATGIDGGEGIDFIQSVAPISASATATTTVRSTTMALADSTIGSSRTVAKSYTTAGGEAVATGIASGDGSDTIINTGPIAAAADGTVSVAALTVSSRGPASADARTLATANAMGINGAAGDDEIWNTGEMLVAAAPRIGLASRTFGRGGNVQGRVGIELAADAKGIAGGDGDDTITNEGDILVVVGRQSDATVTESSASGTYTFTDGARQGEDADALIGQWVRIRRDNDEPEWEDDPDFFTVVEAFDPETGTFTLRDPVKYDLRANSTTYTLFDCLAGGPDVAASTLTAGGRVFVDASTTASIHATGIDGHDGDDDIMNSAAIRVKASNAIEMGSREVGNNINTDMRTQSTVDATGIAGDVDDQSTVTEDSASGTTTFTDDERIGEDPDTIVSRPILFKTGESAGLLTVVEAFDPETGAFTLRDPIPAGGLSTGDWYALGGGSDEITNFGAINVEADAAIDASGSAVTYGGDADIESTGKAQAVSFGVRGGEYDDSLVNWAPISTRSTSSVSSTQRAAAVFGQAEQKLSFEAVSESVGMSAGDGDDAIANAADTLIDVTAVSTGEIQGVTNTTPVLPYLFIMDRDQTENVAISRVSADALGFELGNGSNTAANAGEILVLSEATADSTALSEFDFGETNAEAEATSTANARGVYAEGGENWVFNYGTIDAEARAEADSLAQAETAVGGDDQSTVSEIAPSAPKTFVDSATIGADVDDVVGKRIRFMDSAIPDFVTTVEAFDPLTGTFTLEDEIPAGLSENDVYTLSIISEGATSGSITFRDETRAGENPADFINKWVSFPTSDDPGFATLVTDFDPTTGTFTLSQPIDIPGGLAADDAYTLSGSRDSASGADANAFAYGVQLSNGDAMVENHGEIWVAAFADAATEVTAARGGVSTTGAHAEANAWGIVTGDGDDVIRNAGLIHVESEALADAVANGQPSNNESAIARAIGIDSGAGDDIIINSGTINTRINGVTGLGTAIDAGDGNDQVILENGSFADGSIHLADGNDGLTVIGNAIVTGEVHGGEGTDSLVLDGATNFYNTPISFESILMEGSGTSVFSSLPTIERLEVNEGSIEIQSPYEFAEDGTFQTQVHSDGTCGQLKVGDTAQLDGTLSVLRGPGAYLNGTRYTIFEAGNTDGEFSEVILPASTTLLSFSTLTEDNRYLIEANAASFTTVSKNKVQSTVAEHLDAILTSVTGDLSYVIGEFQALPSSGYGTAFSSLSPDSYDNATTATHDVARQSTRVLEHRMDNLRSSVRATDGEGEASADPMILAYDGSLASLGQLPAVREERTKTPHGVWVNGFGQYGDQDGDSGFTGFNYLSGGVTLGFDHRIARNLIGGISANYANTDIDLDGGSGEGTIHSIGTSLYGSYFSDRSYLDGVLSYASQEYDNERHIVIGNVRRTADSDHDGHAFSACITGGHDFQVNQWELGPFASLQYVYLDEEGFQESGAGGANLSISSRETESLISELGVRVGRTIQTKLGSVVPELRAAWLHDFDIDDRTITASFAGAPNASFSIRGHDVERYGAKIGAGVTLIRKNGLSVGLKYNGEFREDYQAHAAIGGVRYSF
jgi:uncharacterized protein YhjY with autotransporter beta-barrel domain